MKTRKRYIVATGILAFLMVFVIGFSWGITKIQSSRAATQSSGETAVWSAVELEEEYLTGASLTVPMRSVTKGEETVAANYSVVYPDGRATTAKEIVLDTHGGYSINYTAFVSGRAYMDTVRFHVYDPLVSVQKAGSSVSYGKYEYAKSEQGLLASLVPGDSLRFNTAIDVSELTKNDTLVNAFATPQTNGKADFEKLTFTFTDATNPDVYLKIVSRHYYNHLGIPISYLSAGGNGQQMMGVEYRTTGKNIIHIDDFYGTSTNHSFSLDFSELSYNWPFPYADQMPINIRFDSEALQVYVYNKTSSANNMVIDLDDIVYYDTLWSGFESGKVFLEITPGEFVRSKANFCVSEVFGIDLTKTKSVDTDGPEIRVETDYDVNAMPNVERGLYYTVPTATAWDIYDGTCNVKTSVYYNYTSPSAILVNMTDGKFKAEYLGKYAIVYEAADYSGNTSKVVLWVNSVSDVADPTIVVDGEFSAVTIGTFVEPLAYMANSECGQPNVRIDAIFDGDCEEITEGFRPDKVGVYTIRYTVEDCLGQTFTLDKSLTVAMNELPVFVEKPVLEKWYISGSSYPIPELMAYDYRTGTLEKKPCSVSVSDGNETKVYTSGQTFTPVVKNNGDKIRFEFLCEGASIEYEAPCIIPTTVNPTNNRPMVLIKNYFDCDGVSLETKSDGTIVSLTESNGAFTFINPLIAEQCSIVFKGINGLSAFDRLIVSFTDSVNSAQKISVELVNNGDSVQILLPDKRINYEASFADEDVFSIGYTFGQLVIGTTKFDVKETVDGQVFNGFDSQKVHLSMEIVNGTIGGAAVKLISIDNHAVNNMTLDSTEPKIAVLGEYGGCHSIGSRIMLPAVMVGDVLNPNVTYTMKVSNNATGEYLTDVNGLLLDGVDPTHSYTVAFDCYGEYSIYVEALEIFGGIKQNKAVFSYNLIIADEIAPVIQWDGEFVREAKVGDVVQFPAFTVCDNYTAAENLAVSLYYVTPGGQQWRLPNGCYAVELRNVGTYKFKLVVMDEYGNLTMSVQTIMVENQGVTE